MDIPNLIKEFVRTYRSGNHTKTDWEEPLIAFASAYDPLFLKLKTVISKTHSLPTELLKDAETVISYFVPFKKEVVLSNVKGKNCSEEWAIAYVETNKLIADLNEFLSKELEKHDFKSVILPPTHNFDQSNLISDWSHKHIAFIAGLGNFGIHQMLITERGCCGRLGSLVTNAEIPPTKRPQKEFCLYKHDNTCRKCVDNCIFNALKIDFFDRYKCYEVCLSNADLYSQFGLADVCGKCVCVVPCSFINPVK
ncbi:MAG: epoxyqueuosine reductase [Promethearchaeota archaeon]